jgi:AcrR family transcriptional regulator
VTELLFRDRLTPKAQRTREQILEASLTLFRESGFDRTSMRDIASHAGLSLGSTYYYFGSKEELVYAFYIRTQVDAARHNESTIQATSSFRDRLRDILLFKLGQLAEYRGFIVVLARSALEPSRPLSPFGRETKDVRDGAIEILRRAIEGSDLRIHPKLRPHLARLLWLYQMGIIFFWIHDDSGAQSRTRRVLDGSLTLLITLLSLTSVRLPRISKAVSLAVGLLGDLEFWEQPSRDDAV